jgi:hypothetical protein
MTENKAENIAAATAKCILNGAVLSHQVPNTMAVIMLKMIMVNMMRPIVLTLENSFFGKPNFEEI